MASTLKLTKEAQSQFEERNVPFAPDYYDEEHQDIYDLLDEKLPLHKTLWRVITWPFYIIQNWCYNLKYTLQRLFSPAGVSSYDLWSLDGHLAKIILPKLKAFKAMVSRNENITMTCIIR